MSLSSDGIYPIDTVSTGKLPEKFDREIVSLQPASKREKSLFTGVIRVHINKITVSTRKLPKEIDRKIVSPPPASIMKRSLSSDGIYPIETVNSLKVLETFDGKIVSPPPASPMERYFSSDGIYPIDAESSTRKFREDFDTGKALPLYLSEIEMYCSSQRPLSLGSSRRLLEKFERETAWKQPASNREKSLSSDGINPTDYYWIVPNSGTAKAIKGRNVFQSKASNTVVTERCQMEIRNRLNKKFVYVDTPDSDDYGIATNEIRMVAIGKAGSGKSATANTIVGRNVFKSKASSIVVTERCQMEICNRFDRKFVSVDTPGIMDPRVSNKKVETEIVKCIGMTAPGPHAFLYVVSISRFTKEDQDAVQYFVDHFGIGVYKYLIVVFTRIDDLDHDGKSIDEFVKDVPDKLKEILRLCDNRYIGFNNRLKGEESHFQVQLLLDKIDSMVKSNGNQCYTNAIYNEAEEAMRKSLDNMKKKLEQKKEKEEKELCKKLSKQYEKEVSKSRENEERMKMLIKMLQLESQNISTRSKAEIIEISHLKRQFQSARERSDTQSEKEITETLKDMEMKLSDLEKKIKHQLKEKEIKTKKEKEELNQITKPLEDEAKDKTEKEMLEKKLKQLEEEKIETARKERERQKIEKEEMVMIAQLETERIKAELEYLKTAARFKEEQLKRKRELEEKHNEELNRVRDKARKEVEEAKTGIFRRMLKGLSSYLEYKR